MDYLDEQIIALLKLNSRQSYKEIGEKIHLTGQAVGLRIKALEESGAISSYTIKETKQKPQLITIYMNSNRFVPFEKLVTSYSEIDEFYKISGDGCYFLKSFFSEEALDPFLLELTKYARYKLNIGIKTII